MIKNLSINDVDIYIASQPDTARVMLEKLCITIKKAVPLAEEIISYRMPAYQYHGILVYFALWKNHTGFYPSGKGITAFYNRIECF